METVRAPSPKRARTAPTRAPATRKAPARPTLEVVRPGARAPRYGLLTVIGIGALFALFFGLVLFHTLLVQNQRRLDNLDSQVRTEQASYQQLRLQVAQLQSPQRIIDVATTKLGMVPSNGTTYLTPSGADAVAARQVQAAAAANGATTDAGASQGTSGSADGSGSWSKAKRYLGDAP